MTNLVEKQIRLLKKRIKNNDISLEFTDESIKHLAEVGFDEKFGARPLQSVFNRLVIRPLSKKILSGNSELNIKVDVKNSEIILN